MLLRDRNMKNHKYLFWVVSVMLMFLTLFVLNGCSLGGETIPKNRTKEQYEFEKTFEPIFKFLEQDKKDFTGLKAYICDVYIKAGTQVQDYEIDLDITESAIKGDYTITRGDSKETVPVTYSNGRLNYGSELTPLFDEEILNLVVSKDYFASLDVEKTFKSAETELSDVIYEPENHSDLYKHLKNKYDMPDDTTCRIRVSYSSYTIYGVTIQMKSSEKSVQIRSTIFKNSKS
jgi:putative lipoprotein